ncbi:MAG: hypothetical protein ACREDY_27030 [Bradyrhizobium sp.]
MLRDDRPEQTTDDGALADARPACVALVPVVQTTQWSASHRLPRPNSIFVTQLIATAEHDPQTRSLRRATAFDALTAYRTNQHRVEGAGIRPRQTS